MYTGIIGLDETFQHLVAKKTQSSLRERKGGRVVKYHPKDFFEEKWRSQIDEITHFLEIANIRVQVYSTGPGVEMQIVRWTFSCTRVTRQDGSLKIMIRHPGKKNRQAKGSWKKNNEKQKERMIDYVVDGSPGGCRSVDVGLLRSGTLLEGPLELWLRGVTEFWPGPWFVDGLLTRNPFGKSWLDEWASSSEFDLDWVEVLRECDGHFKSGAWSVPRLRCWACHNTV